jgi:hypothetical protein
MTRLLILGITRFSAFAADFFCHQPRYRQASPVLRGLAKEHPDTAQQDRPRFTWEPMETIDSAILSGGLFSILPSR